MNSLRAYFADIKLAHSIFALPFAIVALTLSVEKIPEVRTLGLILICMVSARSFAMGLNRMIDAKIDAENPRTRQRMIPSGRLSPQKAFLINSAFALVFIIASALLSPLAGKLSPIVLALLGFYPMMKRLSVFTHFYLGCCLGMVPLAVEIALTGKISLPIMLIGSALAIWTAGFDMIYAKLDISFDRALGLYSMPARFGVSSSLLISRICFVLMILLLLSAGYLLNAGIYYFASIGVVALLLFAIQYIVNDLKKGIDPNKINQGFFTINLWVGISFCVGVLLDFILLRNDF